MIGPNGSGSHSHAGAAQAAGGSVNGPRAFTKPTPAPAAAPSPEKKPRAASATGEVGGVGGGGGGGDQPAPLKRVFTTGEAAEVCKVSQQTIIRCFDAGRLGGFRVPGSKFRRIPRNDLIRFMKANNIPLENLAKFEGLSADAFREDDRDDGLKRLLIVDDDPAILDMFKDLFASDGRFTVKLASTGYDAGMLTESFRPHLMILDFMLPDMNGDVVCKRLRASEHLRDTKVLFVSGVVSQQEIERLTSAGASGFVAKPFDVAALTRRIESLLEMPAR